MAKVVDFVFVFMVIAIATSVFPVMGCSSYNCNPSNGHSPSTPSGPGGNGGPSNGHSPSTPSGPAGGSPGGNGGGSCPIDALKLGACVDLLGGLVHVGLGNPVVNQCCPLIQGVLELEAALCLCTTIRLKLLNLNIILPLALELFVQCGTTPPPGFKCPPLN